MSGERFTQTEIDADNTAYEAFKREMQEADAAEGVGRPANQGFTPAETVQPQYQPEDNDQFVPIFDIAGNPLGWVRKEDDD